MMQADSSLLSDIVTKKMPYGKYKDYLYKNIPMHYLEWMARNKWPQGRHGTILQTLYEIKLNGLEHLLPK